MKKLLTLTIFLCMGMMSVNAQTFHYDVNNDGDVNINDAVLVVNQILNARPTGEAIDLGLPSGTKWANCNVGAMKPEEHGDYYAWGETEVKESYPQDDYFNDWRINSQIEEFSSCISGTQYDVAHVKWGGNWRMPTEDDIDELIMFCSKERTVINGVEGWSFTGPNGNSIFIPLSGQFIESSVSYLERGGYIWSGTPNTNSSSYSSAITLHLGNSGFEPVKSYRLGYIGLPVRPVMSDYWNEFSLSINSLKMSVGGTIVVDIEKGSGHYSVSVSSDAASVFIQDKSIVLKANAIGSLEVIVTDEKFRKEQKINMTIIDFGLSTANAIDLGLSSGLKWASCNLGATKPEEFGDYYAWGETEKKESYDWSTYIHCDGTAKSCHDLGGDISGTSYDVAHAKWGGTWRMPTNEEMKELIDECKHKWVQVNDVYGIRFTGPNGNSIFLPATGYRNAANLQSQDNQGCYWLGTSLSTYNFFAYSLKISSEVVNTNSMYRYYGLCVRPVTE